jgi:hypothetical protein
MMDYMGNCSVTDITALVRKNREIEEAGMNSMQDLDEQLKMPYIVYGLNRNSRDQKTPYTMKDCTILAAFNDAADAKGYAKSRNIWAQDKYPSYAVHNMNKNELTVLTDLGNNRWALNEVNEA